MNPLLEELKTIGIHESLCDKSILRIREILEGIIAKLLESIKPEGKP